MARLYMYDVRGIQDYIFRTNKIKEIIGASYIVRDLIIKSFEKAAKEAGIQYRTSYSSQDELKFAFDDSIDEAEVVYYGGGNLLVLYSNEQTAKAISRRMCIDVTKKTYSLQLAVASVEVSSQDNYVEDYNKLRQEMERVKVNMPVATPLSGLPFTLNDPQTGLPLSKTFDNKRVSYESFKKQEKCKEVLSKVNKQDKISNIIDDFTEDDHSLVAFVHIDGNGMGQFVKDELENIKTYQDATRKCRNISETIDRVFIHNALENVVDHLDEFCARKRIKSEAVFRPIISAGDDITFICSAAIALDCVEAFMSSLTDGFTACAGVYVTHSHFPFSRAYEYCEELCSNAKKYSRGNNKGNYVDFQCNYSGMLSDLETLRKKSYTNVLGEEIYQRPYRINEGNTNVPDIKELIKTIQIINKKGIVSRGKMKELRDSFYEEETMIEKELIRINSRLKEENKITVKNYKMLFDAVDIMDLKWGEFNEM